MILYFSATGNSEHVARRLAEAAGDRAVSIEGLVPEVKLADGEMLGIVTPTYGWRIPAKVERFLEALTLSGSAPTYAFCVATYGTAPRQGRRPARPGHGEDTLIAGAERAEGGKLAVRVTTDCSGASYREFADLHVADAAHIRTDGWSGAKAGLKGWEGHDPRPFDAEDGDASLPLVHHVISNFKSYVEGTHHGVTIARLQSYADEFC